MKNISIREFVRIILYGLIYSFGLNTIKSCDITVENHSLSPEFKQDLLYIFEIYKRIITASGGYARDCLRQRREEGRRG